jgi:signal transduction histidine kinase
MTPSRRSCGQALASSACCSSSAMATIRRTASPSARGVDEGRCGGITFDARRPPGPLAARQRGAAAPAEAPGVIAFLDPAERAALERLGIAACVPLVSMNRLTGFLLVAPAQRTALAHTRAAASAPRAGRAGRPRLRERRAARRAEGARPPDVPGRAARHCRRTRGRRRPRDPQPADRSPFGHPALRSDFPPGSDRHEMVGDILDEVDRIDEIVQGLLSFARREDPSFQTLDLAELSITAAALIRTRAADAERGGGH